MGKRKTQQLPKDKRLPYRGRRYEVRQLTVLACGQGGPWTWREWWIYDHNLGRNIGAAYRAQHVADHEAACLNRAYPSSTPVATALGVEPVELMEPAPEGTVAAA